jgi:hypothetical protein
LLKRKGTILLILLTITIGLTALVALNNNNSYTPFIQNTNTVTSKNITSASSTSNLTNSLVLRSISINNFGIATVTDVITVRNDGTNAATFTDVYYTPNVWSELLTSNAWSGNIQLNTQPISSNGVNGTRILFSNSLAPGENYTFTLVQYFSGTLSIYYDPTYEVNVSEFNFPANPYSPYTTEACNVSVTLPNGAQPLYPPITYNFTNLAPFSTNNTLSIEFYFTDGSSITSFITVYRQITVDPWLGITVKEFNYIQNTGPFSLSKIYFIAPPGTAKFQVYDAGGVIEAWVSGNSVVIYPRYVIPPNGTYGYYVIYSIPIVLSQVGSSGSYLFTFNILPNYGALIGNFYASLTFNYVDPSFQSTPTIPISSTDGTTFFYAWNNVLPNQNAFSYFTYSIGFPTTYTRPIAFMLIFGFAAIIYVVIRSRRVEEAVPLVVSPAEVIAPVLRDFCDLYDEKNSLIIEMDSLREDVLRRKVRKVEYNQRVKSSEKELSRLNTLIDQKKVEVLKLNNKFEPDFRSLEMNEADRDQAKMTIQHLRRRYLMKRLTKETYIKLTEDQEKKLRKAQSNLDKKIQDLRREAF